MDYGALNGYFDGAVAKTLAAVDINPAKSNQHEFNGTGALRALFGDDDIKGMPTTFAYLEDDTDPVFDHGFTTWYDARRRHPTRTEYRLYYNDNKCISVARPGDLMILAISDAGEVLVAFAKAGTTVESQLRWLFGVGDTAETSFKTASTDTLRIDAMAAQILESIGIEVGIPSAADNYLDGLVGRFGDSFPRGADFSAYSVSTLAELDWAGDPDGSLVACYEREELLFRVFERHILERDLAPFLGDTLDVDGVLRVTMSTFQRRKSRAGTAFENQLSMLFDAFGIQYSAQKYTEGKSKPDFVFPSIEDYRDPAFPVARLTVLGAKTTIKERWRQVLDEADRVELKHLVTLEPAVSSDYTSAMRKDHLQLVVPRPLFSTYTQAQQDWLMDIKRFCEMVKNRQEG
ncbi:type II restriction endonuclease [Enorma phocaeensis]|uniref:Restriction endonuclease type II EcoRII C-terminal domain-containing protein n=1 Tax=Enorma phocaeensis TaxID=1871019 RepID=A0A921LUE9_9ACTN|nr:type II restriction endonuclease [Enorma phocaeensis]HJG37742.1 hypothetical protein [Enorma phocaeensis]